LTQELWEAIFKDISNNLKLGNIIWNKMEKISSNKVNTPPELKIQFPRGWFIFDDGITPNSICSNKNEYKYK
jgi:hypothetical protein